MSAFSSPGSSAPPDSSSSGGDVPAIEPNNPQSPYGWPPPPPPPPYGYAPAPPGWWTPTPPPPRRTFWLVGLSLALVLSIAFAAVVVFQVGGNGSVAATERAVVDINAQLDTGEAVAGTGMVIASNGTVLTNNHVVADAQNISVQINGSGRTYTATVIGVDESSDIAVLSLANASGLPTIPLGDSTKVSRGDHVNAVGNALGRGGAPAVAAGQVTALNQTITATDQGGGNPESLGGMIQFDGNIQPGDSGGPLVNQSDQVVGMDTAGSGRVRRISGNVGFAIPINAAVAIANQITAGKKSGGIQIGSRGVIGIEVTDTFDSSGAQVVQVESGSSARRAGIRAGDLITTLNGSSITSVSDLSNALAGKSPGDQVTVGWQDASGIQHSATVSLGSGPLS